MLHFDILDPTSRNFEPKNLSIPRYEIVCCNGDPKIVVRDVVYQGLFDQDMKPKCVGEQVCDNVSYVEWPGERLFERVTFEINGNILDEYNHFS